MNKKILTAILISIALPGGMLSAPADSLRLKSYKLDEVVVTGTRNETDIRHLPMTISVVGRQQLEQTYQPSILPALTEQVPGLFTTSRGIMGYGVSTGAAGGMSLRGIGAGVNAAGGPTTSLLVLIDGHPQYMGLMGHPIADAYQRWPNGWKCCAVPPPSSMGPMQWAGLSTSSPARCRRTG